MAKFPSLGEDATILHVLKMSPDAGAAIVELAEAVMRDPSPLSAGERELIATYVSRINNCEYCYGGHAETAKAFGIAEKIVDNMLSDLDTAGVDENMKPILRLARKLTESPSSVTEADTQAVYDAGWEEKALHDAIMVVCCFNFMNRLLDSHGVHSDEDMHKVAGPMLKEFGYLPLINLIRA